MSGSVHRVLLLVDATKNISYLRSILDRVAVETEVIPIVLYRPHDGVLVQNEVLGRREARACAVDENAKIESFLVSWAELCATAIAYLPCGIEINDDQLSSLRLPPRANAITPLIPPPPLSTLKYFDYHLQDPGWYGPFKIGFDLLRLHGQPAGCDLLAVFELVHRANYSVNWWSSSASIDSCLIPKESNEKWITPSSSVLAVISHYKCEEWLGQSLHSIVNQTRKPDRIVVIDDASGNPPHDIVSQFPEVTLLSSPENIRSEQILHHIIARTDFDSYLIQDADDWSSENRLELLLNEAYRTGAELIGTQEFDFPAINRSLLLRAFPLDVNMAMRNKLGYYLSHGSCLIARSLAIRIGGFDARFRLSADYDFFCRACLVGLVVNIPEFAHYRRLRTASLTHAADTGMQSKARQVESLALFTKAHKEWLVQRANGIPDARAKKQTEIGPFIHLGGPPLAMTLG